MSTRIVIDGSNVSCVYDDRLVGLLEAIGAIQVRRASEVEYNHATGEWEATSVETGQLIAKGRNRQEVIAAEVDWLEGRL